MKIDGMGGTAWREDEPLGDFVLRAGRRPSGAGREVEHVELRFTDFVATDVRRKLSMIERHQRLDEPLLVDLCFADGSELEGCEIAGYWGGRMGERWYGIDLDLDLLGSLRAARS
jgi:hypothetical protein